MVLDLDVVHLMSDLKLKDLLESMRVIVRVRSSNAICCIAMEEDRESGEEKIEWNLPF